MMTYSLKIALRNLVRHKSYSLISLFGFAVGIAASVLIVLYVLDELSFDRFHKDPEEIFLVRENVFWSNSWNDIPQSVTPLAPAIEEDIPEIVNSVRIHRWFDMTFEYDRKKSTEENVAFTDPSFFEIFNFPVLPGAVKTPLEHPNRVAISQDVAKRYFGDENPVGKSVRLQDQYNVIVDAVFEDLPANSSVQGDVLISFATLIGPDIMGERETRNWRSHNNETFVRIVPGSDPLIINEKMKEVVIRRDGPEGWNHHRPYLAPLVEYRLKGDYRQIILLLSLAAIILLLASINYMNLSTARSYSRAREIGVKKVLGSSRGLLIRQFISESVLLTFAATLLAILVIESVLPQFNNMCWKELSFDIFSVP